MEKAATHQLSSELVKQQLRHVLDQEEFKRSPVLSRFLEFIVLTKLSGKEEEIKEYTIGIKALGRPIDFNPQLDSIVRIHASRLRNVLSFYYSNAGFNSQIIITIPKGTYVPVFETNGGQHGKTISNVENGNGHANGKIQAGANGHNLDMVVRTTSVKPVLAVLPFHDLSSVQPRETFLNAFGEELCTELAKFDNLSVISYYVTRELDTALNRLKDFKSAGIDHVLTGSVRLFSNESKFNVQLINIDSGNVLWSETFLSSCRSNEEFDDSQDDVVRRIANAIVEDSKIFGSSGQQQGSPEKNLVRNAVNHYFDYGYDYNSQKFASTLSAVEQAYEIADNNALIVSMLSKLYLDQYACMVERDEALLEKGLKLAHKSVALSPRSQYAQKALAWGFILAGDKQKAEESIDSCISINPHAANSLSTLGLGLIMKGDYENGYSMLSQALKLQQHVSACGKLGFSLYHYHHKNFRESKKWLDVLTPFDIPFSRLLNIAIKGNLHDEAIAKDELPADIKEKRKGIVERIVYDPDLRTKIAEGWGRAGL